MPDDTPFTDLIVAAGTTSTDRWTVRAVTVGLALLALLVVAGGIVLALDDKEIPEALVAIGSGAAGALAALLARTTAGP